MLLLNVSVFGVLLQMPRLYCNLILHFTISSSLYVDSPVYSRRNITYTTDYFITALIIAAGISLMPTLWGTEMTRRRWINVFLFSFIPLGIWVMLWLISAIISPVAEPGGPGLGFIIPVAVYGLVQVWLAFRAFKA